MEKYPTIVKKLYTQACQYESSLTGYKQDPEYASIARDKRREFFELYEEAVKEKIEIPEMILELIKKSDEFYKKYKNDYHKYVKDSGMWLEEDFEGLSEDIETYMVKK